MTKIVNKVLIYGGLISLLATGYGLVSTIYKMDQMPRQSPLEEYYHKRNEIYSIDATLHSFSNTEEVINNPKKRPAYFNLFTKRDSLKVRLDSLKQMKDIQKNLKKLKNGLYIAPLCLIGMFVSLVLVGYNRYVLIKGNESNQVNNQKAGGLEQAVSNCVIPK